MKKVNWFIEDMRVDTYFQRDPCFKCELTGNLNRWQHNLCTFEDIFDELDKALKGVNMPTIKRVIFNPPATIILWTDGTKSVVKCQNGEPFDAEKGFALAYLKKLLGNKNEFNKEIHKWVLTHD